MYIHSSSPFFCSSMRIAATMFLETRQPALAGRTHTLPQTVANLPRATLGEAAEGGNSDRRCGVVTGCGTRCRQASTLAIFEPAIRATGAPGKRGQTGSNTPRKRFTAPSQNYRGARPHISIPIWTACLKASKRHATQALSLRQLWVSARTGAGKSRQWSCDSV